MLVLRWDTGCKWKGSCRDDDDGTVIRRRCAQVMETMRGVMGCAAGGGTRSISIQILNVCFLLIMRQTELNVQNFHVDIEK